MNKSVKTQVEKRQKLTNFKSNPQNLHGKESSQINKYIHTRTHIVMVWVVEDIRAGENSALEKKCSENGKWSTGIEPKIKILRAESWGVGSWKK